MKIKPVHFEGLNCLEDQIVSIVAGAGKTNYPLIFSESWRFNFEDKSKSIPSKKNNDDEDGSLEFHTILGLLKKYCGVKTNTYEYKHNENPIDVISNCLQEKTPTVIDINSFWCPWDDNYQKIYHSHFCIPERINSDSKELICIDAWYQKGGFILPFDHVNKGSHFLIKFAFDDQDNSHIDLKMLVLNHINTINNGINHGENIFQMMRTFAKNISVNPGFINEVREAPILWQSPIFFKFQEIQKGRAKYSKFLEYLSENTAYNFSKEISQLISVAVKWSTAKTLLTKAVFSNEHAIIIKKLSSIIKEIADFEESIVASLLNKIEGKSSESTVYYQRLSYDNKTNEQNDFVSDYVFLNLSDFLNNKGIDVLDSINSNADLTGNGHYILADDKLNSKSINLNSIHFKIPQIANDKCDNIVCTNQTIEAPKDTIFNSISVLGCTVWDDMLFNLELNYKNGSKLNLEIGISQWIVTPMYGEDVFWEGNGIEKSGGKTNIMNKPVRLFAKKYKLPLGVPLEYIKLPDCPNIHIFAISLEKKIFKP